MRKLIKTKVCHLTSVHQRYDTRVLLKECSSLSKHGYEVHLVVADGQGDENYDGVKIHDVGKVKGRLKRFYKSTQSVLKKGLEIDAELYHFHDPELMPAGIKLKKKGKKVIYDTHEDLPRQLLGKDYLNILARKPLATLLEWYENYAAARYDFIVTATPHIQKRFSRLNPLSLDINNYPLLTELNTETTDWAQKKEKVCYVGSITQIRGLTEVIEAMGHLKGVELDLAGNFWPLSFKENLEKRKGWEKVNYLGQIDREQVTTVLRESQVGIVTFLPFGNHTHSLPNKLFEYMAQGIPLVASNFNLWKVIIETVGCGVCVDPTNPKSIVEAIQSLLDDTQRAKQMGERGRDAILKTYNWKSEEKKLLDIYKNLLA